MGIAESCCESIVVREFHGQLIETRLPCIDLPLQHHLFQIVLEYRIRVTAQVGERIQVRSCETLNSYRGGKLRIPHP